MVGVIVKGERNLSKRFEKQTRFAFWCRRKDDDHQLAEAANGDVILADKLSSDAYKWDFVNSMGGWENRGYKNAGFNRYLQLSNGETAGSQLILGTTFRDFELNGLFINNKGKIQSFDHKLCLGLQRGKSCIIGDKIILEACSDSLERAQVWEYELDGKITNTKCDNGQIAAAADGSIIHAGFEDTEFMKWNYVDGN